MPTDSKLISPPREQPKKEKNEGPYPVGPSMEEAEYPMNHRRRGKAIIFNHFNFENETVEERLGTGVDEMRLQTELSDLGFEVDIQRDKKYEDIQKKLEARSAVVLSLWPELQNGRAFVQKHDVISDGIFLAANEDHSDADCLVVVVMSHGNQIHPYQKTEKTTPPYTNVQYSLQQIAAYDRAYDEKELFRYFEGDKCQSLIAKPKIFFIQACRGDGSSKDENKASRYMVHKMDRGTSESETDYIMCTVPNSADFLIFRATVDGSNAFRGESNGSYFIRHLCNELEQNRMNENAMDLESLLVNVKRNLVAEEGTQMPCVYSTLLRKLYFKQK